MSDQPTPEQHQPDAPPKWFQDYTRDLGGVLQQQNAAINALARDRQAAQPPKPAPAAPADPTPFRAQIHDRFLNEPERLFAETIAFAEQRAEAKIAQTAQQMRAQMEQERQAERFWGEFYHHNPELAAFQAEVGQAFAQTDPNMDASLRANAARDFVRAKLQSVAEQAKQSTRQQQQDRRSMAGAPGGGYGGPERSDREQNRMSDIERTAKAVAEREKYRASRAGAYDVKSGNESSRKRAVA